MPTLRNGGQRCSARCLRRSHRVAMRSLAGDKGTITKNRRVRGELIRDRSCTTRGWRWNRRCRRRVLCRESIAAQFPAHQERNVHPGTSALVFALRPGWQQSLPLSIRCSAFSMSSDSCGFHKQSRLGKLCLAVSIVVCFINLAGHDAANGIGAVLAQKQSGPPAWRFLA